MNNTSLHPFFLKYIFLVSSLVCICYDKNKVFNEASICGMFIHVPSRPKVLFMRHIHKHTHTHTYMGVNNPKFIVINMHNTWFIKYKQNGMRTIGNIINTSQIDKICTTINSCNIQYNHSVQNIIV